MQEPGRLLWTHWDEVDRLLAQALDLPAGQREHFIRNSTDDSELCGLLLRLVGRVESGDHGRVTGPDKLVVADAFGMNAEDTQLDFAAGTAVGRYAIVSRRARGGMATVYEAERSDGVYEQRVALKVLRRGLDTEDLIRRFRTERQILSSLSHPNIARLLDGGATDDGRPYLVMELVEGDSITRFADTQQLDVRARLELFLGVADAVHAAHQQLVVHRDIKPSNILIDRHGRVKLLDFGVAKLVDPERTEHTEGGARTLTPDYASPEQLRGDSITTATDVYQLGLLLRELLCGVRPFATDTITGEPPVRPSRAAVQPARGAAPPEARAAARASTVARLTRQLQGDLDVIVGKALRTEPSERYASADELSTDVRRHLDGLPILAHPESTRYRMAKFARRHSWSVGAGAVSAILLVSYAVTATVQGARLAAAGVLAQQEARTADQVTEFLVRLFQSGNPTVAVSDTVSVLGILEEGARRIDTALADQPAVRARMLLAIGRAFTGLGRYSRADTLLAESLRLERELRGPDDLRVADVLRARGSNFRISRNFRAADEVLHEELRTRLANGPVRDTVLAGVLENLASTRRDIADVDSAVSLIRRAVALRRASGDTVSASYANALLTLAFVLRAAGSLDSAETIYREAIQRRIARLGPDDYTLASPYNNLGFLLRTRGDFAAAEAEYRHAVRIVHRVLGAGHPTSLMLTSNLASALEFQEKFDEVESIGRERIAAAEQQWPEGHWRVGAAYQAQGQFLLRMDRAAEAVDPLRRAAGSYTASLGPDHTWTVMARVWQGVALLLLGETRQAEALMAPALDRLTSRRASLDEQVRFSAGRAADLLDSRGHDAQASRLRALLVPPDSVGRDQ